MENENLEWNTTSRIQINFSEVRNKSQELEKLGNEIDNLLEILYNEFRKMEKNIESEKNYLEIISKCQNNLKDNINYVTKKINKQANQYEELNYYISGMIQNLLNNLSSENYCISSNNNQINNDVYSSNNQNNNNLNINEEVVKQKIEEKFKFNKSLTEDFTKIVYEGVKEQILGMISGEQSL